MVDTRDTAALTGQELPPVRVVDEPAVTTDEENRAIAAERAQAVLEAAEAKDSPEEVAHARARLAEVDGPPFISEGMRHDLETRGWTIDPRTGKRVELADTKAAPVAKKTAPAKTK